MATTLEVPYVTQKDPATAGYSINDCGPACVAMMARAIGKSLTPDQIYRDAHITTKGGLYVWQVQKAANLYGLNLQYHDKSSDSSLSALKRWVDEGRPALVLVNYTPIMQAGLHQSTIIGGHYVVVVGYDDNTMHVHDPYWNGTGGAYRKWPIPVFNNAWYQYGTVYTRIALVPAAKIAGVKQPPYAIPEDIARRLRAKAMFDGTTVPEVRSDEEYRDALTWLGAWGEQTTAYTIQPGDTLGRIAEENYGNAGLYLMIATFNDIRNPALIYVGQAILLPLPEAAPAPIPEPEPVRPEYTFTNQQLINAFYRAYKSMGEQNTYWDAIVAAGLSYIASDRTARYNGPDIMGLPNVPDVAKRAVLAELGLT
jgi:hypothetical protein